MMASVKANAAQTADTEEEYITSVIYAYLNVYGIDPDGVSYSNAYPVLNSGNDTNVYFVKRGNNIVAEMIVVEEGDTYSSRFDTSVETINALYHNNTAIALVAVEEEIVAISGGTAVLDADNSGGIVSNESLASAEEPSAITFPNELQPYYQTMSNAEVTSLSGVRSMGGNASGICWAVSVAMMVNYKKGTSYTGQNIVSQCQSSSYYATLGTPQGTIEWVRAAYALNGISINDTACGLIYARLYSLLSNNKPVHMDFYASDGSGHAVVLCGTYWDGNTLVYTYCDPNYADEKFAVSQDKAAYDDVSKIKFVTKTGKVFDECTHVYYY